VFEPTSEGEKAVVHFSKNIILPAENFKKASTFVHTKFDGAWRPIGLKTGADYLVDRKYVRLKFTLPPGQYATTVCREFMKTDPVRMI